MLEHFYQGIILENDSWEIGAGNCEIAIHYYHRKQFIMFASLITMDIKKKSVWRKRSDRDEISIVH